jgi:cardiolipin synthase A/B
VARVRDGDRIGPRERLLPVAAGVLAGGLAAFALTHRVRSQSLAARRDYTVPDDLDVGGPDFMRAVQSMTGATVAPGNTIESLVNGDRIFPELLGVIRGAERTLNLLTYVYWRGDIAVEVAEAVADRARAGVECRVLIDAIGAARMEPGLVHRMERAGVRVARFRPVRPYTVGRLNNRTHRKILVADGTIGMTGGVGIAAEWTGDADDPDHWRDTHFRVEGPIVAQLHGALAENWLEATGELLAGDRHLPHIPPIPGGVPMQLVRSGAACVATDVEALFFLALHSARRSILLTTAYFVPQPAFVDLLIAAARRGVDVQVMMPGPNADKPVVRAAGWALYQELIDGGVTLLEYQPTMLHAKTLVVDGRWSAVGSVNFDARSFQLNDEAALCVQDAGFAHELAEQFARDRERCLEIDLARWGVRPLRLRAREGAGRLLRGQL